MVLTRAACERYGLPAAVSESERLAWRLPEGHKIAKQMQRADWQLTKRGPRPWARIYRPIQGGRRQCVQLCIPSWHTRDERAWGHAARLEPAELARVVTPVGYTAVAGLHLSAAPGLRP
ncbi:hypothetical protein ADK77_39960 [Streptomyces antibioticus]|nr:hypothetical protein ADK77_39960 [Streptomyces antibioticus]